MPPRLAVLSACARHGSASNRLLWLPNRQCRYRALVPQHKPISKRNFHASAPSLASSKNPYDVLGVKKDASSAEIKKTYFSLARKYHPDTNPDKTEQDKFLEIQEAYDILKDDKKRAAYDQYGAASQQPGFDPNAFSGGFPGGGGSFSGFEDFARAFAGSRGRSSGMAGGDLFEQLFGGLGGSGQGFSFSESSRGSDIRANINISFLDACKGTKRKVNINPVVSCRTCSGTGLKHGAKRTACTTCGGTGQRTFVIQSGFHMASTCTACSGTGFTIPRNSECPDCDGGGRVREKRTIEVEIPAGVEDGMEIRVPKAGDHASGHGASGDLLLRITVAPSKTFVRQGQHLFHEARIPLHTALLGGRVTIPTLDGDVDVRVPPGTQQGEEMVLKGRGVRTAYGGPQGDQFVSFSVQIPRTLTAKQKELFQQYADDIEGRTSRSSSSASNSNGTKTSSKNAEERKSEETEKKKKVATG